MDLQATTLTVLTTDLNFEGSDAMRRAVSEFAAMTSTELMKLETVEVKRDEAGAKYGLTSLQVNRIFGAEVTCAVCGTVLQKEEALPYTPAMMEQFSRMPGWVTANNTRFCSDKHRLERFISHVKQYM